jgi:hypothetical protein
MDLVRKWRTQPLKKEDSMEAKCLFFLFFDLVFLVFY